MFACLAVPTRVAATCVTMMPKCCMASETRQWCYNNYYLAVCLLSASVSAANSSCTGTPLPMAGVWLDAPKCLG